MGLQTFKNILPGAHRPIILLLVGYIIHLGSTQEENEIVLAHRNISY